MTTWFLLVLSVISGTAGDLLTAKGMSDHGEIHDFRPNAVLRIAGRLSRNVYIVTGILAQAISFFSFVALLGVAELSFAVPATALGNVAKTIFAKLFLKEHVGWRRWTGALLVSFGVLLVSM
jgi:drug/metabolite transporter (DMT)-like permease